MIKLLPKIIDILSVFSLLATGLFLIGITIMFSDYAGPPTPDEQAETMRLFAFGASLCVAGIIVPLRTFKRALIALLGITTTALLVLFLDGGQPDVADTYIMILIIGIPLYFLRKIAASKK